jgi:hypothetical protein
LTRNSVGCVLNVVKSAAQIQNRIKHRSTEWLPFKKIDAATVASKPNVEHYPSSASADDSLSEDLAG